MLHKAYQVFDSQNIPIVVCDKLFNIIFMNKFMKDNTTCIKIGDNLYNYSPDNNELLDQASNAIKAGKAFHSSSFSFNYIDHRISFVPLQLDNNTDYVVCYIGIHNDRQVYFQDADFYSVYDTFQCPTIRILNLLPQIAQKLNLLEEYDELEHLNKIAKNSYQILRKSAEVSDYYKLINNKITLNLSYHVVNSYLENLLKALQLLLINDYTLTYEICDEKLICLFDEEYLSIALFHIISNSCVFSPKGSNIHVTLKPNNDLVIITVTDEGIGIPQEKMDKIFNAFYTKMDDISKSFEHESIGLGLPITKKIMESFNGKLFISSEVNNGTSVVLALPMITDPDIPLTIKSDRNRYITNRLSNMYIYFSNICDVSLF